MSDIKAPGKMRQNKSGVLIRTRRLCDRSCPAFGDGCPMVPLAVQPADIKKRVCLVNQGPEEIQRVYKNIFAGGHPGIIEEMQKAVLEYGTLLRNTAGMTVEKRLQHIGRYNSMLERLDKLIVKAGGRGNENDPGQEEVQIDTGEIIEDPESLAGTEMGKELGLVAPVMRKPEVVDVTPIPDYLEKIFSKKTTTEE